MCRELSHNIRLTSRSFDCARWSQKKRLLVVDQRVMCSGMKFITFVIFCDCWKWQVTTIWENGKHLSSCRNADLNSSITCPFHLIRLVGVSTTTSSPRWRRSSVVVILTEMIKSLLLWTSFWRSKMPTSTKTRSICSTNVGLKCVNVENGCVDSVAMQHFTNTIQSHVTFVISCRLEFICYLRAF